MNEGVCKTCGCTDSRACPGGCYWVGVGLCSRCKRPVHTNYNRFVFKIRLAKVMLARTGILDSRAGQYALEKLIEEARPNVDGIRRRLKL